MFRILLFCRYLRASPATQSVYRLRNIWCNACEATKTKKMFRRRYIAVTPVYAQKFAGTYKIVRGETSQAPTNVTPAKFFCNACETCVPTDVGDEDEQE